MTPDPSPTAADLRRRAEAVLPSRVPPAGAPVSSTDAQRLLHALQVHQIELEMQNSELQQTRDTLAAVAARYTDLYDFAPVGYLTLGHGGAIVEANLAAAKLLGSERAGLAGRRFAACVADADRHAINRCIGDAFAADVPQICEVLLAANGTPRAVRIEATRSADGAACRVVLHDISARRHQEAEMRLLETCVAQLNDIVLVTDTSPAPAGPRIVFANAACERTTGYSRTELVGQTPRMLQGPGTDRAELARIGAALRRREPVHAELLNSAKDGRAYWIEIDITPVLSAGGLVAHFVSVQRDITERRDVQAQLARQVQALQTSNDELYRFNRAMIDRELRMLELKAQVNALHARLGEPARYAAPADAPAGLTETRP